MASRASTHDIRFKGSGSIIRAPTHSLDWKSIAVMPVTVSRTWSCILEPGLSIEVAVWPSFASVGEPYNGRALRILTRPEMRAACSASRMRERSPEAANSVGRKGAIPLIKKKRVAATDHESAACGRYGTCFPQISGGAAHRVPTSVCANGLVAIDYPAASRHGTTGRPMALQARK